MYIKSKNSKLITITLLILGIIYSLSAKEEFNFTSRNGLKIRMIKTSKIGYISAHLLIHFSNDELPPIPFLALINIFEQNLTGSKNGMFDILHKLGNDLEVKYGYDHIIIKINMLPEQINYFASFLRKFYKFSFSNLKKFDISKKQLLSIFKKKKKWKKSMATQIAYQYLFKGQNLGNSFFFAKSLEKLNIVKLRSFLKRKLIPRNSLLVMKGDINPYLSADIIKKAIGDIKSPQAKSTPAKIKLWKLPALKSEIFLFPANCTEPTIFRFKTGIYNKFLIYEDIINEILFGHKTGIILSRRYQQRFALTDIKKDILKHKDFYVFCNSFKISYRDISSFIRLLQNPQKFLKKTKYSRLELIQTMNYMKKAALIQNSFIDKDLTQYVYSNYINFQGSQPSLHLTHPSELLTYTGTGVSQTEVRSKDIPQPIIVIIGDQEKLFKNNPALRGVVKIIQVDNFFK
jgi:hypothetical protein